MTELSAQTHSRLRFGMRKKTERTKEGEVRERLEFGQDSAVCLGEEAIFVKLYKCPYHVKLDLDLDHENILDAGLSGDHRV